jgi:uncharacterized membrane protein YgcG
MKPSQSTSAPGRPRLYLAAALLACLTAAMAAIGWSDDAGAAKAKLVGKTKRAPGPNCPKDPCEVIGSVTGFQSKADGERGLFKIRQKGHVVAWSADLSRPSSEQREFFEDSFRTDEFGSVPTARIGILENRDGERYELKKQSPTVKLSTELGGTPVITLNDPLRVAKGDIVAITVPTWLPNFATELTRDEVWRASRSPQRCTGQANLINRSRPHQKVDDARRYGCRYVEARLLYWAYFVPESREGGGGGGQDGGGGGQDGGGGGGQGGGGGGRS